jgi:hypothetical protein
MFGFLAPRQKIPKWRQSYARVCQYQRLLFGVTALPFLSYAATFLYQLGIDFELIPALAECAPPCCRRAAGYDASLKMMFDRICLPLCLLRHLA